MGRFVTWQKFYDVSEEPRDRSIRAVTKTHALTVLVQPSAYLSALTKKEVDVISTTLSGVRFPVFLRVMQCRL
jgi:CRISPR/Cas system-associated endoribonuclease Cas2